MFACETGPRAPGAAAPSTTAHATGIGYLPLVLLSHEKVFPTNTNLNGRFKLSKLFQSVVMATVVAHASPLVLEQDVSSVSLM